MLAFDPIQLIELGYETRGGHLEWQRNMMRPIIEALAPGDSTPVSYRVSEDLPQDVCTDLQSGIEDIEELVAASIAQSPLDDTVKYAATLRRLGFHSLSGTLGYVPMNRYAKRPFTVPDVLGISLIESGGTAMVFEAAVHSSPSVDATLVRLWSRLAAHLSAALRVADREQHLDASDVEAVVTPDGTLAHVSPALQSSDHARLLQAARGMDAARMRKGRHDPFAALELWQGLLAGRWSLVEHFDSDGRRFLLVRRNDLNLRAPDQLTARQRQIVFFASTGCTNQEIAYALGLGESTVSTHLRQGLAKLGLSGRGELIQVTADALRKALANPSPRKS